MSGRPFFLCPAAVGRARCPFFSCIESAVIGTMELTFRTLPTKIGRIFFRLASNESLKHKESEGISTPWTFEFVSFMKVPI
ncbi:hypothetical protein AVP43_02793 [Geobacillus stearothermophilus]|nr:hypothetical protein AVP43_02793 [Geobacillus stearothermophilus]